MGATRGRVQARLDMERARREVSARAVADVMWAIRESDQAAWAKVVAIAGPSLPAVLDMYLSACMNVNRALTAIQDLEESGR